MKAFADATREARHQAMGEEELAALDAALEKSSARVAAHMNDDHAQSLLAYAHYYARLPDATGAKMVGMSAKGFDLEVTLANGSSERVLVPYNEPLTSAADVRKRAVAMHMAAFHGLGFRYKLLNGFYKTAARQALHHMPKEGALSMKQLVIVGALAAGVLLLRKKL